MLVVLRVFVGIGIGGLAVPFDILAEFMPSEIRGKALMGIEYFWYVSWLKKHMGGPEVVDTEEGGFRPRWRKGCGCGCSARACKVGRKPSITKKKP